MQSLEIISVNLWQILISLCNLILLYLILKKFLYQPVKKVLAARQAELDQQYQKAQKAESEALTFRDTWQKEIDGTQQKVEEMMETASTNARQRGDRIIADAREKAEDIIQQAHTDARLERERVYSEVKGDIVDISMMMVEKMLPRNITEEDQRKLIGTMIEEIGEDDGRNQ